MGKRILTTKEFIEKSKNIHKSKYDYSHVIYVKSIELVKIACPRHGIFLQSPHLHLSGYGCRGCSIDRAKSRYTSNLSEFVEKAIKVHGVNFKYTKAIYITARIKMIITCIKHGDFLQSPDSHLRGHGCIKCFSSKPEKVIRSFLKNHNICFEEQVRFNSCKDKRTLPFDFVLEKIKTIIEYNGELHYKRFFFNSYGRKKRFNDLKTTKRHDAIKTRWAKDNGYRLLRIPYTEFNNIEAILTRELGLIPALSGV